MLNGYKIIALCLSRIQDVSNIDFVSELNDKLSERGYRIFLFHISTDLYWSENNEDSEISVYELIDYSIVDTIIIMDERIKDRSVSERIISNARKTNIPVIIADGYYENCVNVQFDYKAGFEEIVRHVITWHNPKKLHYMAGNRDNKFSDERKDVFRKVLEEQGIDFDESMVSYGDFWAKPTIKATLKLIERGNLPDAIICANDIMAINVIDVLKRKGYQVPKDVIVTGFDGIEEVHLTEPIITTGYCNYRMLAGLIADLITQEIINGDYYVMPTLMISESCGCTYSSKINILESSNKLNSRFYRYQDDNRTLTQIAEKMQSCINMEDVPLTMENRVMNHMCCILNHRCTDDSVNPVLSQKKSFDDEMYLLFDANAKKPFRPTAFARKDIVPGLDMLLKQKYPLIFAELDFMNVSIGYVCFYYKNCDSMYYAKIPQIVNALNSGIGGLINRRYQQYLIKQIEHMHMHDSLTGLYNRFGFNKEFDKMVNRVKENKGIITVVLADLDGLKDINDNYGHVAGDNAIHTVANALKHSCPPNALCVRFGGDEMLAVIEGNYSIDLIREKMNRFLDNYNSIANNPYLVSTSLGILKMEGTNNFNFEALLKSADELMYEDKKRKKK